MRGDLCVELVFIPLSCLLVLLSAVAEDLVGMLVKEGIFNCPSCRTQQSVNRSALEQYLKQAELDQKQEV